MTYGYNNTCEQCGTQTRGEDICLTCILVHELILDQTGK